MDPDTPLFKILQWFRDKNPTQRDPALPSVAGSPAPSPGAPEGLMLCAPKDLCSACSVCLAGCLCPHSLPASPTEHTLCPNPWPGSFPHWEKSSWYLKLYPDLPMGTHSRFLQQPCPLLSTCPPWSRLWFVFYYSFLPCNYPVTLNNVCTPFESMISMYWAPVMGHLHITLYCILITTLWSRN